MKPSEHALSRACLALPPFVLNMTADPVHTLPVIAHSAQKQARKTSEQKQRGSVEAHCPASSACNSHLLQYREVLAIAVQMDLVDQGKDHIQQ